MGKIQVNLGKTNEEFLRENTAKKLDEIRVPIEAKYSLNIPQAAEYFGIGEKRLYGIIHENEGADFILELGSHVRIKRRLFEEYLDEATTL